MHDEVDLAVGWLAKAGSDMRAARLVTDGDGPYDTACFHAQRAIEKSLKQYIDQQPGFEQQTADRAVRMYNVDRDRAEVVVEFKSRADGSIRLMHYHLRREGATWAVKEARPYTPNSSR